MCDCEPPEFFDQATVTARKEHACCECFGVIRKGERYASSRGKWDGDFAAYKTCARCSALRLTVQRETDCCVPFCELYGEIREQTRYDRPTLEGMSFLERRAANMRRRTAEAAP